MGGEGYPCCPFQDSRKVGDGMANHKDPYARIRGDSGQRRRIVIIALLLGCLVFVPVAFRLYKLMVVDHGYYSDLALRNQSRTTNVTTDRGQILDRNMNILASSETVETVYLDPHELRQSKADIELIAQNLADILELQPEWIKEQAKDIRQRYKRLKAKVSLETADEIRQFINENNIKGIHLEPESKRYYPYGELASQVIGFANASNTGCEGIEAAYNSFLEGSSGKVITTKGNNEMDMPFSHESFVVPRDACDVVLTLDTTVQACLEKQMELAIQRYDVQNGAFGMVMNVNTGEILAMATLGGYDPNNYLEVSDPEVENLYLQYLLHPEGSEAYIAGKAAYQEALTAAQLKQWRNRCISDGYEPGSTFKVLTMAAALDCGAITLETPFHCSGAEQIPGRAQRLHCWRHQGHGAQKTPQALQNSCNLAFAHIALKLGGEKFYEYVKNFGILEKTGIDLAGESKGVFFDKALVTDTDKWGTASLTSGSFGQTFKLTPLQLVRAISCVVNGGTLMEPYLVSQVLDSSGNIVLEQTPTPVRQVISPETSKTMCMLMESVVTEGTAKNASVAGFSIGGKTGTSEKIDVFDEDGNRVLDKIVSFVGVAPMDDPQYIVLVALDTPSRQTGIYISGGVMAAPTVGAVMADILPYLEVERCEPYGQLITVEEMEDITRKEAQTRLQELGFTARCIGDGASVTGQIPAAGTSIPYGSEVLLYFGEEKEETQVVVPGFIGMTRQQAADTAGKLGLYIQITGNRGLESTVTVTAQSIEENTQVPPGTTIQLEFTDTRARD